MKNKAIFPALACGVISAMLNFWLIPAHFARGIPDYIWMTCMIILPVIAAILLLRKHPPMSVLWSAAVQCIIVIVLANPIGRLLGYQLGDIANDLFDYIGYILYAFGWIASASLAQFTLLSLIKKLHR